MKTTKSHKEHLNKHKVEILKRMVAYVNEHNKNEIPLSILRDNINDYNNAQKLRYHALIFKVKRGTWGITNHGAKFLRGKQDLPAWVRIENNHIKERSAETVNIRKLNQGQTVVATFFDYYDNDESIGVRPAQPTKPTQLQFMIRR